MTADFEFDADDDVVVGGDPPGYRMIIDFSEDDATLIDALAKRDGLQPTQILTEALHEYARRSAQEPHAVGRSSISRAR